MKRYRTVCSQCSSERHPEFRDHEEIGSIITCLNCGYKLERKKAEAKDGLFHFTLGDKPMSISENAFSKDNYILERYNGRKSTPTDSGEEGST